MKRIQGVIFVMLVMLLSFNCSKRMTESQQQYIQQQRQLKEQNEERISAQTEGMKSDDNKDFIVYFNNGKQAHNSGNFAQAIELFDACLNLKPDFAEAWGARGFSKYKSGDSAGACADWKRSVELGGSNFQSMVDSVCK